MRLLIAGINWPPETFIRRLVDGLVSRGVEVTVGSSTKPEDKRLRWLSMPSWDETPLTRMLRLGRMSVRASLCARHDLKLLSAGVSTEGMSRYRELNRLLPFAGRRWDIIYFPWNTAAISCLPAFDLGCPVVVSCRGAQVSIAPHVPSRESIREGLQRTFERARAVHCVSEAIKEEAVALGMRPEKAFVIRPAVDVDHFRPGRERPVGSAFHVITTGSLIWRKGHEYALQSIKHLVDAGVNVHFSIIGEGQDRQRLLFTIQDLGLQAQVTLHGKLPPGEVLSLLQKCDAFFLSSHSEGISNAALEALACGLPVVTTNCGGMNEAIRDGVEGFVVPVRDSAAMASALHRLAESPEQRTQMGMRARERAVTRFNLKDQIEQWMQLLNAVVSRN